MKKKKYIITLFVVLFPLLIILISNYSIENYSKGKTFSNASEIKKNKVGLVLGTAKMLSNGMVNLYFKYRIDATVELFKKGRIDFVLISGDNGNKSYDEPTDFKNELMKYGIPEDKIFLDYAGFRTLDSVVRCKEIFGQDKVTIISQKFHNERAIYLAHNHNIEAVGFNAKDVSGRYGLKVKLREYLARTKVFIDILFRVKPKFLGKKIEIK
ncbi:MULTISPECIES: vancomycin high temperature exclusion protein [unclassified Tenacibaculum]|uniref:SanA/YdcF family protein n=1 Tax=unclassified Tenacibaculum TaxID=2635139 RepID=UPI001F220DF5|nr:MULTISPECIES: ElyC/SanA/YdcF family protein [unclassified Tenacibaculum]MCF2876441.1 YdcF family protein [Tenacibaculum sp. Cn5-1]MCF2936416.1 YdcF family protein [Tenacibaculum sp. Cn5-34]MCG7512859.1 YdcF family protein [Tenacibaculum sp. Cn5-46]